MGKNNPYHTGTEENREKTRWWKYKTNTEIKQIRRKIGDNLKQQYAEGKLIPYSVQNPEWGKQASIKRLEGYKKYLKSDNKYKFGNPSQAEKEIANILEEYNIKYVRQATISDKYSCDLLLPEYNLVIEYYGTYWHCDPRKYEKDYYNQKKNKTAQQIWDYDLTREKHIKESGYTLMIIWEDDFKCFCSTLKKETIYASIKSKSSK
jgi:G:T-mismatch repair DNA endonuclease (very short patch repair protein)